MKRKLMMLFCAGLMAGASFGRNAGVVLPKGALLPVVVENLNSEAKGLGLTEEYILSKIELQLRRNGLNPTDASDTQGYYIYVDINVIGNTVGLTVEFKRIVGYTVGGQTIHVFAATWSDKRSGTFVDGGRDFIMRGLLDHIDVLSNDILKSALPSNPKRN